MPNATTDSNSLLMQVLGNHSDSSSDLSLAVPCETHGWNFWIPSVDPAHSCFKHLGSELSEGNSFSQIKTYFEKHTLE